MPGSEKQVHEVQKLFLQNSSLIRGFVLGLVPNALHADDIFQEIFLSITEKANEFKLGTNFLAWVRSFARFKVLEFNRKETKLKMFDPETMDLLISSSVEIEENFDLRRQALGTCLDGIAPRVRKIMDLRYTESLSSSQISQKLSWTKGAVDVALTRVRKALRECIQSKMKLGEVQ